MIVPVVDVREVRMAMSQAHMRVGVDVRLPRGLASVVRVPVVLIVNVAMRVHHGVMGMLVLVSLGQMQPDAGAHQRARHEELRSDGLSHDEHRDDGAEERGEGEVRAGPGGSDVPEGHHEQHQADAVAGQPHQSAAAETAQTRWLRRRPTPAPGPGGAMMRRRTPCE